MILSNIVLYVVLCCKITSQYNIQTQASDATLTEKNHEILLDDLLDMYANFNVETSVTSILVGVFANNPKKCRLEPTCTVDATKWPKKRGHP